MTEKLYDRDAYATSFSARVLSCDETDGGFAVVLDRTAFFPEEGGQDGDVGRLGAVRVCATAIKDGVIVHLTDGALPVGETVDGEIDWAARYDRMQNHSAEHIVSGLVHRLYGLDNVGFHLGAEETTVDFSGVLDRAQLDEVEDLANRAIWENIAIDARYPSRDELAAMTYRAKKAIDGAVRIVTIPGYDACACCAPHVARTGEIGLVKLLDFIHYKGGVRVRLLAGGRALRDYRLKFRETAAVSRLCSVKQEECGEAVARLLAELDGRKAEVAALSRELSAGRAAALVPGENGVILHFEGLFDDEPSLRRVALDAAERTPKCAAVFRADGQGGYRFYIAAKHYPLRETAAAMRASLAARGGGTDELISGRVAADEKAIREFFSTL